ncbi:MAG: thioredoxin [Calditrichia bacterium]|nr:thioredoxin [Calditrichia bacterium]
MSEPIHVSDGNFKSEVLESSVPVLVDFWAPWCGPCKVIAPVIEELAKEYEGKFKVTKLNTDENPNIAMEYRIMGIPTLGIFVNGKMVDQLVGAYPKPNIVEKIDYYLQGAIKN